MLEKMELQNHAHIFHQMNTTEKAETVLLILQALKNNVSVLRMQCEELRKLRLEEYCGESMCQDCGVPIEPGQEIVVKDSDGNARTFYHQSCFKRLLRALA